MKHQLEEKAWFRFAKVLYIVLCLISGVFLLLLSQVRVDVFIWGVIIIASILILIRKAFYYIILGKNNIK